MVIKGTISFPGDKSLSHRALILASLCKGESSFSNLSTGMDVSSTKECLIACGINIISEKNTTIVKGGTFNDPNQKLDCGNSGTTTRLLVGLLAGRKISATFIGDASLSSRPMNRILLPLAKMGLKFKSENKRLPIRILKSELTGLDYKSPIASAQVKSSVLLATLGANEETCFKEPILSRDHTERMLKYIGADISFKNNKTILKPLSFSLSPFDFNIPGDPSTAAFFAGAASVISGSNITVNRVLINPTRIGFFRILERMGASVKYLEKKEEVGELIGNINITQRRLDGVRISAKEIPDIIDELPIIAIIATQAKGITKVTGAKELRMKECDRIHAISKNLTKMGAKIKELDDGFIIQGPTVLKGAKIETFKDHRIAMAFSIAGLIADGAILLDHPECVKISYPDFFVQLSRVCK